MTKARRILFRSCALLAVCWWFALSTFADTLTFVAQPAATGGDDNWFNAINWFITDSSGLLVPAGRAPLANETAVVTGTVDLQASGVRVQTLVVTNNAIITNGTVAVEHLQLLSSTRIDGATVNVLNSLNVAGTNCVLNATTLDITGLAAGTLEPIPPATESSLVLTQASVLQIGGMLTLKDHTRIAGAGLPASEVVIQPGAFLVSDTAEVHSAAAGSLIVDNSGTVIAQGGSLTFSDGIAWKSSGGMQEFRAAGPSSTLLFNSPFQLASGVTGFFTGDGTNRWVAGATIDGIAQVSVFDAGSPLAGPGHLQILNSVTGSGTVHILGTTNQGGVVDWANGLLALPGLSVDPGANLLIGGGAGTSRQLAGSAITNEGICTFYGGNLDFTQGAAFINLSNALFVLQDDGSLTSTAGGGIFSNAGVFQKTSPGISQFGQTNGTAGPDFNNSGLLDVRAGQLSLFAGADAGEFRVATGTLLWFWGGTHTLGPGTSFTGSGAVRLAQGAAPAKWLVNDAIIIPQLELGANATLDASGVPAGNLIQITNLVSHDDAAIRNGQFQIQSFQMLDQSLLDHVTIAIAGSLTVAGTNCTLQSSTLNNFGACTVSTGNLVLAQDAVINNVAGSTFLLQTNSSLPLAPANGPANFHNAGSFLNSVGNGANDIGADFNNAGRIEVLSGTLNFQGALKQTQGITVIDSGAALGGGGFTLTGGTITGSGVINATLVNTGGTVSPGVAVGILSTGAGKDYEQGAAGNLFVEIGGTSPGVGFDHLIVAGNASLDGQLEVIFANGFVPQVGQTFQVVKAGSLAGRFAGLSAPSPAGMVWVPRYSSGGVSLVVAGNLNIPPPYVSGGGLNLSLSTTPGIIYVVQVTDELNPAAWQAFTTIIGDGTVKTIVVPMTQAHRFCRILLQ